VEGVKQVEDTHSASVEVLNASSTTKDGQPKLLRYNHADAGFYGVKIVLAT